MDREIRAPAGREWQTAIVFVSSLLILLTVTSGAIRQTDAIEVGDSAANSLLVLEAKQLRLTVGNYSRAGFNHPGPALLYVLAAGEVLFFDLVPVGRTPVGGQTVGLAVWNALMLALISRAMSRSFDGWRGTGTFCAFVLVLARLQPEAFTSAWFPQVYVLLFGLFLAAIVQWLSDQKSGSLLLGAATGLLWNAHVAFVPITGIVLALTLIGLIRRAGLATVGRVGRRSIVPGAAVFALLQLPLLIESLKRWPSPLRDYVSFNAETPNNDFRDALRFTGSLWPIGRFGLLWAGVVALLWLLIARRQPQSGRALGAGLAASVAVLFYAVVGIDNLSFRYVAFFYRSAIALMVSVSALLLGEAAFRRIAAERSMPNGRVASRGAALAVLLCVIGTSLMVRRQQSVVRLEDRTVTDDYQRLLAVAGNAGVRLHIDIAAWDFVWPRLAGVQLLAARSSKPLSCVATRWQVVFTRERQCRAQDNRKADVQVHAEAGPSGNPVGLRFVPIDLTTEHGDWFVPGETGVHDAALILGSGWSSIEAGRVWSASNVSDLVLRSRPGTNQVVELEIESLIGPNRPLATARVDINGVPAATWTFSQTANRVKRRLELPPTEDGISRISLRIDKLSRVRDVSGGADRRSVGVSLLRVEVR